MRGRLSGLPTDEWTPINIVVVAGIAVLFSLAGVVAFAPVIGVTCSLPCVTRRNAVRATAGIVLVLALGWLYVLPQAMRTWIHGENLRANAEQGVGPGIPRPGATFLVDLWDYRPEVWRGHELAQALLFDQRPGGGRLTDEERDTVAGGCMNVACAWLLVVVSMLPALTRKSFCWRWWEVITIAALAHGGTLSPWFRMAATSELAWWPYALGVTWYGAIGVACMAVVLRFGSPRVASTVPACSPTEGAGSV